MRLLIGLFSPPTGTFGGLTRGLAVAGTARGGGHEVEFAASGAGNIWFVLTFSGLAYRRYLQAATRAYLKVVRAAGPDVLFTGLDPVTLLAGQITGLPAAVTYASVMEHGRGSPPWRALHRAASAVLREHGHPPSDPHRLYFSPHVLKITPSVPQPSQPSPGHDHRDFTPDRLRALLGQRDRYTAGAATLGEALRASNGPNGAIDALEQHAASAQPRRDHRGCLAS